MSTVGRAGFLGVPFPRFSFPVAVGSLFSTADGPEKAVCSGSGERSESCFPRFSLQGIYLYIPVENVGNRFPHPAAGVFPTLFQTLFSTGV